MEANLGIGSDAISQALCWLAGPNTGTSSKAMLRCAFDLEPPDDWSAYGHPHDPDDFNRCLLLVEQVPAVRERFDRIAILSDRWGKLIARWDELRAVFIDEAGWNWSKSHRAPKTYALMREILAD